MLPLEIERKLFLKQYVEPAIDKLWKDFTEGKPLTEFEAELIRGAYRPYFEHIKKENNAGD